MVFLCGEMFASTFRGKGVVRVFRVRIRKRVRKGKYVERRINVPVDFPEKEEAVLLVPEDFEEIISGKRTSYESNISGKCSGLIDGKYYVLCPKCGRIAHFVVEDSRRWFYCPYCNVVFPKP